MKLNELLFLIVKLTTFIWDMQVIEETIEELNTQMTVNIERLKRRDITRALNNGRIQVIFVLGGWQGLNLQAASYMINVVCPGA